MTYPFLFFLFLFFLMLNSKSGIEHSHINGLCDLRLDVFSSTLKNRSVKAIFMSSRIFNIFFFFKRPRDQDFRF